MQQKKSTPDDQFESIALCHLEPLFRLAYARTANRQDAEDIVQETYLKAFAAYPNYRGETSVRSWLSQILINTVRDHFRKRFRRPQTVDISEALEFDGGPQEMIEPGPEHILCQSEIDPVLAGALKSLPDSLLLPLLLREIHEASYEEIATALDVPMGTVMSRLFRARERVRSAVLAERKPGELRHFPGRRGDEMQ